MKITYVRSGGFAGLKRELVLDQTNLSDEEISELEDLIINTNFFGYSAKKTLTHYTDIYQYEITVDFNGQIKTIRFGELDIPAELRKLVEYLNEIITNRKLRK